MKHTPCDTVFLRNRGLNSVDDIAVITHQGPYRPLKVLLADAIATQYNAQIRFITAIDETSREEQVTAAKSYHEELADLCTVSTESIVVRTEDIIDGLVSATDSSDIAITGTVAHSRVHELIFGDPAVEISNRLGITILFTHARELRSRSFVRGLVERLAF
ncbi:MAG: hypothetical protein ABEI86_06140 [Halobacteriaceae archaeon]